MNLDGYKSTLNGDIFVNILKSAVAIHLSHITNTMNFSIEEGHFPDELSPQRLAQVF